jgi:hypothetical protein
MGISGFPKFKQYTEAQMPLATAVSIGTEVFNTTYQVKMRSNGTSWEWLGIGKSTWENKPATAPLGQIICITDVGENGILCRGNGTKWVRMHPTILYNLGTPIVLTGTTAETTLLTITIPAALMGLIGRLNMLSFFALTNNANNKTLRAKIGANSINTQGSASLSATGFNFWLLNLNSATAQRNNTAASFAIDTTASMDLIITGQLANAADSMTLNTLSLELI